MTTTRIVFGRGSCPEGGPHLFAGGGDHCLCGAQVLPGPRDIPPVIEVPREIPAASPPPAMGDLRRPPGGLRGVPRS